MDTNFHIRFTDNQNEDFIKLVNLLDKELNKMNGVLQNTYSKHNKLDYIKDVILIYKENNTPIACGAFKEWDKEKAELKRIFVINEERGKGISRLIVKTLEELALSKNYKYAVLETGKNNTAALNLYKKSGYTEITNYEPYTNYENSVCMMKEL